MISYGKLRILSHVLRNVLKDKLQITKSLVYIEELLSNLMARDDSVDTESEYDSDSSDDILSFLSTIILDDTVELSDIIHTLQHDYRTFNWNEELDKPAYCNLLITCVNIIPKLFGFKLGVVDVTTVSFMHSYSFARIMASFKRLVFDLEIESEDPYIHVDGTIYGDELSSIVIMTNNVLRILFSVLHDISMLLDGDVPFESDLSSSIIFDKLFSGKCGDLLELKNTIA